MPALKMQWAKTVQAKYKAINTNLAAGQQNKPFLARIWQVRQNMFAYIAVPAL